MLQFVQLPAVITLAIPMVPDDVMGLGLAVKPAFAVMLVTAPLSPPAHFPDNVFKAGNWLAGLLPDDRLTS
jgi:hypothetical protein